MLRVTVCSRTSRRERNRRGDRRTRASPAAENRKLASLHSRITGNVATFAQRARQPFLSSSALGVVDRGCHAPCRGHPAAADHPQHFPRSDFVAPHFFRTRTDCSPPNGRCPQQFPLRWPREISPWHLSLAWIPDRTCGQEIAAPRPRRSGSLFPLRGIHSPPKSPQGVLSVTARPTAVPLDAPPP